jgi:malonate-semialdehyde dehydrogenase (acetylating)/methylmalonate-semialdehyde dehydrogenase
MTSIATHSFGGWKASIFGDHPIYGPEGIRFSTRPKVVSYGRSTRVRWS